MLRLFWFLAFLVTTQPIFAAELQPASLAELQIDPMAIARAEALVNGQVKRQEIAGVTVCVLRKGRIAHLKAYGYRDAVSGIPARVDDIVRIYSMSKPIVSVAAMQLWEKGHFQLDDPIADYIPSFRHMKVLVTDKDGQGKPRHRFVPSRRQITVRDVFRHTTGIAYGGSLVEPVNRFYESNKVVYWYEGMYPPRCSLLDGMTRLGRVPLLHHPGEKFTYGLNVDILGRLIEICSGQQLSVYLQQHMFEPLQMVDTAFHVPDSKLARFGPVHDKKNGAFYRISAAHTSPYRHPPQWESGGGGLVSTISDYANFCQAVLDGGQFGTRHILKASTVAMMFDNQLPKTESRRFGLGFGLVDHDFGSKPHSRRATAYRWGGYASTKFHIVPNEKLVMITMRQRIPGNSICWNKLVPIIHSGLKPLAK